jgi:hypothetical protein
VDAGERHVLQRVDKNPRRNKKYVWVDEISSRRVGRVLAEEYEVYKNITSENNGGKEYFGDSRWNRRYNRKYRVVGGSNKNKVPIYAYDIEPCGKQVR